jgi:hypothetical protein
MTWTYLAEERGAAMTTTVFYNDLTAAMALPPPDRHQQLARLHGAAEHLAVEHAALLDRYREA